MRTDMCLTAVDVGASERRTIKLARCDGSLFQQFSTPSMPRGDVDLLRPSGPWAAGSDCVDFPPSRDFAYIGKCHGGWNQLWAFTDKHELMTSRNNKCLEYDLQDKVYVRDCSGNDKQKWLALPDGHVKAKGYYAPDGRTFVTVDKCLDADLLASDGRLHLVSCKENQDNQKFRSPMLRSDSQDQIKVQGPWADGKNCVNTADGKDAAFVSYCNGYPTQIWELTADDTLRTASDRCLQFSNSAADVRVVPCARASEQRWRSTLAGEIKPRGFAKDQIPGANHWWSMANKCLEADSGSAKLRLADCNGQPNQKFHSRALPTVNRDLLRADGANADRRDVDCVTRRNKALAIERCLSSNDQLWELTRTNEIRIDAKACLTAAASGSVEVQPCDGSGSQRWRYTASGRLAVRQADAATATGGGSCIDWKTFKMAACDDNAATQKFASVIFGGSSGAVATLADKADALAFAVQSDKFLTQKVLDAANAFVKEADRLLASSNAADSAAAKAFALEFLFEASRIEDYRVPTKALFFTAASSEFLLMTSVLLQFQSSPRLTYVMAPFVMRFSDDLKEARYAVLADHVLSGDLGRVEAYMDGTFSDFDQVGGMLSAVCRSVPIPFSMCTLATYFEFMDAYFAMRYRLVVEGAAGVRDATAALAKKVVDVYRGNTALVEKDPIWQLLMALMVFRGPFIGVLSDKELPRVAQPDQYLHTFLLYSFFEKHAALAPFEPAVRFLSDQATKFHIDNIMTITAQKDVAALETYMFEPFGNAGMLIKASATPSDFPLLARHVVPRVCNDPTRAPLSLCKLEDFHTGLQSMLRFERERQSNKIELSNLLEVDVRKKLDVIDQEKKQFEVLTTLQEVANKIGASLNQGFADLKKKIDASTSAIRQDIERTRKDLRNTIGSVGQTLLDTIDSSTTLLYNQVGQKAAEIRRDIYQSTRHLEQRLDDTGRAILGEIEQSKRELKYQIGAEAERTREHISAKSEELKQHMTQETQGLREFIDVKTNEIIGVVREEGSLTREHVDQATNQIVRVVQDEGAITRAFVDTKTNEVVSVVRAEAAETRTFIDVKTNEVVGVVREEARTTRAFVDEKGNQVIGVVKDEGQQTRAVVREESKNIRSHIDTKTAEVVGVVREEGKETRSHITSKAAELRSHISSEANGIKDRVDSAKNEMIWTNNKYFDSLVTETRSTHSMVNAGTKSIISSIKSGTGLLAGIDTADCVDKATSAVDFEKNHKDYTKSVKDIKDNFQRDLEAKLNTLVKTAQQAIENHSTWATIDAVKAFFTGFFAGLFGMADTTMEIARAKAQVAYNKQADARIERVAKKLLEMATTASKMMEKLQGKNVFSVTGGDLFSALEKASKGDDEISAYEEFDAGIRPAELVDIVLDLKEVQKIVCDVIQANVDAKTPGDEPYIATGVSLCYETATMIEDVGSRYAEALTFLDNAVAALAKRGKSGVRCANANKAIDWSKSSNRRLQETVANPSEPFYAMTYVTLSRLLWEYRMQEAAFQFCKFYEYKNGGVAPPMCGDNKYYTLSQIQEMRAWRPPVLKRVDMRVMIPTRPVYNANKGRFYPYVDLERLRAGMPVIFRVPTWDLDWLKKYRWIFSTVKEDNVPSVYVESMRLYLPFERANPAADVSNLPPFAVTVNVEPMTQQMAAWNKRDKVYMMPRQTFRFETATGEQVCASENQITNPYHDAARCTQDDGSSEMCMRDTGASPTQNDAGLLPSLFSPWKISIEYDRKSSDYNLTLPRHDLLANGTFGTTVTTSPDLNLIADLTVVQVYPQSGGRAEIAEAAPVTRVSRAASACCAEGEYRVSRNKCQKCPDGTKSVLFGYSCSAA
ncbi:hypothetical protein PINS_up005356 [Pythium insidiosum]|nr:hypothetical protein PINS_up005356 [Pythium insidiosum]